MLWTCILFTNKNSKHHSDILVFVKDCVSELKTLSSQKLIVNNEDDNKTSINERSREINGNFYITNPYVLILGLSEYEILSKGVLKNLPGVTKDVENMKNLFKNLFKYQHVYSYENTINYRKYLNL